ncbi:hypothetical protein AB4144_11885 [Rhizobiaceae sp. 2RAB30]
MREIVADAALDARRRQFSVASAALPCRAMHFDERELGNGHHNLYFMRINCKVGTPDLARGILPEFRIR